MKMNVRSIGIKFMRWASLALAAVVAAPLPVFAQSCALCYANGAAANPTAFHALKNGVVILMVPPILIFSGIMIAFQNRDKFNDENAGGSTK